MKALLAARRETVLALLVLTLVVCASYWKLTTMSGVPITDDVFTSDLMNDGFPYRFYLGESLKGGEFPLWYPPVYSGFPLVARAESGTCYPLNILLFGVLSPYVALNVVILLTIIVAGTGMYFFAREVGADLFGALLAGFAFAYSGFLVSHLKHLSMVNSACWFPLGLLCLERALGPGSPASAGRGIRIRWMLGLALVFAMQNLAGHMQIAYYSALVYCAYYLARVFMRVRAEGTAQGFARRIAGDGALGWFVAAMAAGTLLSAVQLIPTYELVQNSQRAGGVTFEYAAQFPYDPASALMFFSPSAMGDPAHDSYTGKGIFWEDYGYVGLVTLLGAFLALLWWRRQWHVRFFASSILGAYLIVLGSNTPVFRILFTIVPLMNVFRFPTRMMFVVDASLAVLAALGVTSLMKLLRGWSGRIGIGWLSTASGICLLVVAVVDLLHAQLPQNAIASAAEWREPPRTAVLLSSQARTYRIFSDGAELPHINAYSQARGWGGSLEPYVRQREFLQPCLNVLYGFSIPNGYAQLTPRSVVDVWGDQNRPGLMTDLSRIDAGFFQLRAPYQKILSLFNVRTILSPQPLRGENLTFRGMVGDVHLYDNPRAQERAFVVGSYRIVRSDSESLAALASPSFDPSREVILFDDPKVPARDSLTGSASVETSMSNDVVVRTDCSSACILVLSDTYYPGWEAHLDGRSVPLLRANHAMRAVVVPPGLHHVSFAFRPKSVAWGLALSLGGGAAIAGLFIFSRRMRT